jgi:excinuclease ABC subunit A
MVDALDTLLDSGSTVVVAEHNITLAASADWVIDLGPGAGPEGGRVIAQGAPHTVAEADTPTAAFLRRHAAGLPLLASTPFVPVSSRPSSSVISSTANSTPRWP